MTPLMPFLVLGLTLAIGVLLSRTSAERARGELARAAGLAGVGEGEVRTVGLREWITIQGFSINHLLRIGLVALWLGAVVADFVWMWPIFTGGLLTNEQWQLRMWFPSWI
jgi:dolichyl-phosphate-mannose--protein O-mannosyl transferase